MQIQIRVDRQKCDGTNHSKIIAKVPKFKFTLQRSNIKSMKINLIELPRRCEMDWTKHSDHIINSSHRSFSLQEEHQDQDQHGLEVLQHHALSRREKTNQLKSIASILLYVWLSDAQTENKKRLMTHGIQYAHNIGCVLSTKCFTVPII